MKLVGKLDRDLLIHVALDRTRDSLFITPHREYISRDLPQPQ